MASLVQTPSVLGGLHGLGIALPPAAMGVPPALVHGPLGPRLSYVLTLV